MINSLFIESFDLDIKKIEDEFKRDIVMCEFTYKYSEPRYYYQEKDDDDDDDDNDNDDKNDDKNDDDKKNEGKNEGKKDNFFVSLGRAIKNFIVNMVDKILSLFGAKNNKLTKEASSKKFKILKDPQKLIKFATQYNGDAEKMLQDAKEGKLTVEQAVEFTKKQGGILDAIVPFTGTAVMIYGKLELDKTLNEIKQQTNDLYDSFVAIGDNPAVNIAHMHDKNNRAEETRKAAKIMAEHIQTTNKGVFGVITNFLKKIYAENCFAQRINEDVKALEDPKAAKQRAKDNKAEIKAINKQGEEAEKDYKRIEKNADAQTKQIQDKQKAEEKRNEKYSKSYSDVGSNDDNSNDNDDDKKSNKLSNAVKNGAKRIGEGLKGIGDLFKGKKKKNNDNEDNNDDKDDKD